jgi:S1-C subfamily serine protease
MIEISIPSKGAHKLIKTLIVLGSTGGALSPARKELILGLSQRFKVNPSELSIMAQDRRLEFATDEAERNATYLAAAVLLSIDHQPGADQGLLAKLAGAYGLTGPALEKLNKLAEKGSSILGSLSLSSHQDPSLHSQAVNATSSIPTAARVSQPYSPVAELPPRAPAAAVPFNPIAAPLPTAPLPTAPLPTAPLAPLPVVSSPAPGPDQGGAGRSKAAVSSRRPKLTRQERKKKRQEDSKKRAGSNQKKIIILSILFPLILMVGLIAYKYVSKRESASNKGTLLSRYNDLVTDFNRYVKRGETIRMRDIAALKKQAEGLNVEAEAGGAEDKKLVKTIQSLLSSVDFQREWQSSVSEAIDRLALEVSQARNLENFPRARQAIEEIPAAYLTTTELRRDYDRLKEDVDTWETFTATVAEIMAEKEASVKTVKRAYWSMKKSPRVSSTQAYKRLMKWFGTQRSQSDPLFKEFVEAVQTDNSKDGVPIMEMLELIEPNIQDFFERKRAELTEGGNNFAFPAGKAIGTGFFVKAQLILTNSHVVGLSNKVKIQMKTGDVQGTVIARDKSLDLALVRIKESGPALSFCKGSILRGQTVFAYGYGQLGSMNSTLLLTKGLLSAIQDTQLVFDAKVNPGNSGGPLIDAGGRWLGVVVAKTLATSDVDSFAFAVHGIKVVEWLEKQKVYVTKVDSLASGLSPPEQTAASIVRIEALSVFGK